MEKISPKLPLALHKEKIQSSCMGRLADALNCKDGRSNQKLLSNGKNSFEAENSRKADVLSSPAEKGKHIIQDIAGRQMPDNGAYEEHVKNFFRKESATEKKPKKSNKLGKKQHQSSGSHFLDRLHKNNNKPSQSSEKTDQKPASHSGDGFLPENQLSLWSDEMSSDKQKLAARLDEICRQMYQENIGENIQRNISPSKRDQLDESNRQLLQLRAKAFIDQIYISGNYKIGDGSHSRSKQFLEAAELLKLNMDVFLKLLRDPYSLFVKNIRNLQFLPRSNNRKKLFLESKSSEGQNCIVGNHQDVKGKVKTHERDTITKHCSPKGNATFQFSNKTLAYMSKLKVKQSKEDVSCDCASLQSHQTLKSKNQTTRDTYLSFKDVKQTLKQAVGENKKKQTRSSLVTNVSKMAHSKNSSKDVDGGTNHVTTRGSSAFPPNAKRRENKLKPVDLKGSNEPQPALISKTVSKKFTSVFTGNPKKGQLDISKETKQKLSERLKNVHSHGQEEFASFSPNRHGNHVSTQERCFLYSNLEGINSSSLQNGMSNNPKKHLTPDNLNAGTEEVDDKCSYTSDTKTCGSESTLEANTVVPQGNTKILAMLYEPMKVDVASNEKITGKFEILKENGCKESTKLARAENRANGSFLDPSIPLHIRKLQIADDIEDKEENTSPISVLEPFSSHEVSSPTRILSEPAKSPLQPGRKDRKDFLHLYVRNIIQFSGMNFHELYVKGISLKNTISSCPNDGVTRLANKFNCDHKLLLDCIHEVMLGVYQNYFGRVQRLPFLKPDRLIPLEEKFIDDVVKQVNFYLLPKTGEPPVDQLVGKDLSLSGSWLDLHSDTEDILIQVAEDVLLDSIVDTILEVQI